MCTYAAFMKLTYYENGKVPESYALKTNINPSRVSNRQTSFGQKEIVGTMNSQLSHLDTKPRPVQLLASLP